VQHSNKVTETYTNKEQNGGSNMSLHIENIDDENISIEEESPEDM